MAIKLNNAGVTSGISAVSKALKNATAGINSAVSSAAAGAVSPIINAAPALQAFADAMKTGQSANSALGNIVTGGIQGISQTGNAILDQMTRNLNSGSAMANQVSAEAQRLQNEYNKQFAEMQMAFNSAEAAEQRRYNKEMWQLSADFNSAEAQKNRDWQEMMSNTAYQRAIQDMKKAGINPILAAMNGGAPYGTGSTASVGVQSGSSASASMGGVGNFTGQGNNMSEMAALIGAIGTWLGSSAETIGAAISTFGDKAGGVVNNIFSSAEGVMKDVSDKVQESQEKWKGTTLGKIYGTDNNLVWPKGQIPDKYKYKYN